MQLFNLMNLIRDSAHFLHTVFPFNNNEKKNPFKTIWKSIKVKTNIKKLTLNPMLYKWRTLIKLFPQHILDYWQVLIINERNKRAHARLLASVCAPLLTTSHRDRTQWCLLIIQTLDRAGDAQIWSPQVRCCKGHDWGIYAMSELLYHKSYSSPRLIKVSGGSWAFKCWGWCSFTTHQLLIKRDQSDCPANTDKADSWKSLGNIWNINTVIFAYNLKR